MTQLRWMSWACVLVTGATLRGKPSRAKWTRVALVVPRGGAAAGGLPEGVELHLAGKIFPTLRLLLTTEKLAAAFAAVVSSIGLADSVVIAMLWFGSTPMCKLAHAGRRRAHALTADHFIAVPVWERSTGFVVATALRRLGRLMTILYLLDLCVVAAVVLGLPVRKDLPLVAATVAYPLWAAFFASQLKAWGFGVHPQQIDQQSDRVLGRALVYNRLGDIAIGFGAILVILEILSLELGVALTSLLALSGMSSVVVALACQEPLSHLVNGLVITFNDKFEPGDEVLFGDTAGVVTKMGWFDTHVRGNDECTVIVPNGKLVAIPVVNKSRDRWSQYKTEVHIGFEDQDKIEGAVAAIRETLATQSDVITPPTRPVLVHWLGIGRDCLEIHIDIKLAHPHATPEYYDAVEQANLRIARALRSCDAHFALPTQRKM